MSATKEYNKIANKLVNIEDKFMEIEPIIKTLDIWIKENDYQLIPVMNMLNEKFQNLAKTIRE